MECGANLSSYGSGHCALANEVLEAVRKSTPQFFEEIVVDLLVAMGYGGQSMMQAKPC
jgi:restriction system protein